MYTSNKKRLHKVIASLLAAIMLFGTLISFAGCSENPDPQTPQTPEEADPSMRIMSFNIRYKEITPERIDLVIHMIEKYKPDSIGFQEVTDIWIRKLVDRLGETYGYVTCGRNADGKGEASSIFYLKSRFELIEGNTKWLSKYPDTPGTLLMEASLPRIVTWAVLKDNVSGETFAHVNTHLDHQRDLVREMQIEILFEQIKHIEDEGIRYVLTGDFNCSKGSTPYQKVIDHGMTSSVDIAEEGEEETTYNGYGNASDIIDFIFLSSPDMTVSFYKVCSETFPQEDGTVAYPSDHYPIIADIMLTKKQ